MEDAKRLADAVEKVQCFFSNLDFSPSPTPRPPPPHTPPPPPTLSLPTFSPKKRKEKAMSKVVMKSVWWLIKLVSRMLICS